MRNDEILDGAKEIAERLKSPNGQIKFARVVRDHLGWFDLVERRGLTWKQIGDVLASVGAFRENGLPFTVGHLSSTVWRARQEAALPPILPSHRRTSLRSGKLNGPIANGRQDLADDFSLKDQPQKQTGHTSANEELHAEQMKTLLVYDDRAEIRRRMAQAMQARRPTRLGS